MREFGRNLGGNIFDSEESKEPCPLTDLLSSVEAELADEDEARHVRAHVVHCRECSKKFLMLRGIRNKEKAATDVPEQPGTAPQLSWWTQCYERACQVLIDIGRQFDPGTLIGTIRVTGPIPALALRGESSQDRTGFMFEVPVGNNVYGFDLRLHENELAFDVAGYKWADKIPATITVYRESGAVLGSTTTDLYGNAHFSLEYNWHSKEKIVLAIALSDDVWESLSLALGDRDGR
ncbi:MAG TPA: hypothetical protein VMU48_10485 [Terracidiphilus sp.]|nr:hypothetical protein [Terracidiphilus sp.]